MAAKALGGHVEVEIEETKAPPGELGLHASYC